MSVSTIPLKLYHLGQWNRFMAWATRVMWIRQKKIGHQCMQGLNAFTMHSESEFMVLKIYLPNIRHQYLKCGILLHSMSCFFCPLQITRKATTVMMIQWTTQHSQCWNHNSPQMAKIHECLRSPPRILLSVYSDSSNTLGGTAKNKLEDQNEVVFFFFLD